MITLPETLVTIAYLAAGILFILSLGGLSAQESARRGNLFGMLGMALAVGVTAFGPHAGNYSVLIGALVIGGAIGAAMAARVEMTDMPQLVAMLHSFVGLAAVLVGFGGTLDPANTLVGVEATIHSVETFIGVFVGAVTFTGSIVAFGKLRGIIGSRPLLLPGRHAMNAALLLASLALAVQFVRAPDVVGVGPLLAITILAAILGIHLVMAIGGGDMPVVVWLRTWNA